jgi:hypothetical protein
VITANEIWVNSPTQSWHALITQHLEEIEAEQSILLALLLEWEHLVTSKAVDMNKLYSLVSIKLGFKEEA